MHASACLRAGRCCACCTCLRGGVSVRALGSTAIQWSIIAVLGQDESKVEPWQQQEEALTGYSVLSGTGRVENSTSGRARAGMAQNPFGFAEAWLPYGVVSGHAQISIWYPASTDNRGGFVLSTAGRRRTGSGQNTTSVSLSRCEEQAGLPLPCAPWGCCHVASRWHRINTLAPAWRACRRLTARDCIPRKRP
jgi:hypothetical protein